MLQNGLDSALSIDSAPKGEGGKRSHATMTAVKPASPALLCDNRYEVTCDSALSTETAHSELEASISTTGVPPATAAELRAIGAGTPSGGSLTCSMHYL